jgi:hypothetical protein
LRGNIVTVSVIFAAAAAAAAAAAVRQPSDFGKLPARRFPPSPLLLLLKPVRAIKSNDDRKKTLELEWARTRGPQ